MKILWHSNSPWVPTGYGNQSALCCEQLAKHHQVTISSFYGLEGAPRGWNGIPVLPGGGKGDFGNVSLVAHAERVFAPDPRSGLVITLMDVWVLDAPRLSGLNVAAWTPVDHEPAPPRVVDFFLQSDAVPIAMSRFGQSMLGRLDPLYVPHCIDTDVYQPVDPMLARGQAFPEDAFVVGMVAANKGRPSRKGFSQALLAFKRFMADKPNAYLYLHTMLDPSLAEGENLPGLLKDLEIPDDRVRIADQYAMLFQPYTPQDMAKLYSALDVLLNPSLGEGFGIPIMEAQACGTPVIVTDCTAMSELCASEWKVTGEPFYTGLGAWQTVPHVNAIVECLEDAYTMTKDERELLGRQARRHALQYDVHKVVEEHWLPALRVIERRFRDRTPVTIPARSRVAA